MKNAALIGVAFVLLAFALLMLPGCATRPPPATLPVAESCVPAETPAKPEIHTPEQLAKAPTGPDRYAMMAKDYLALFGWSLSAGPVLEGCRKLN